MFPFCFFIFCELILSELMFWKLYAAFRSDDKLYAFSSKNIEILEASVV